MRACAVCLSNESYRDHWYKYGLKFLCQKCKLKIFYNPKWHPLTNPRRVVFRGKQVYVKVAPRIGVCNYCRAVKDIDTSRTQMHHEEYHEEDPLKDTIEICLRCHACVGWGMNPFEISHFDDESDDQLIMIINASRN